MKSSTSWPPSSRKYSAIVRPDRRDAQARARRLVHLAVDQRGLVDDAALLHLQPEVVALAGALAHAGEHRQAAVLLGDVVDQLLDEHRLAHAGAAEEADLAALHVRREQVDDLDAGLEDLLGRVELVEGRGVAVDRPALGRLDVARPRRSASPSTLKMRPSVGLAHRHRDRPAGVGDRRCRARGRRWCRTPPRAPGRRPGAAAPRRPAAVAVGAAVDLDARCRCRGASVGEVDVDHDALDLDDRAGAAGRSSAMCGRSLPRVLTRARRRRRRPPGSPG